MSILKKQEIVRRPKKKGVKAKKVAKKPEVEVAPVPEEVAPVPEPTPEPQEEIIEESQPEPVVEAAPILEPEPELPPMPEEIKIPESIPEPQEEIVEESQPEPEFEPKYDPKPAPHSKPKINLDPLSHISTQPVFGMDFNLTIKERVARIVESLGRIDPSPELSAVLEKLIEKENIIKQEYRDISDLIEAELFKALTTANERKTELAKIDVDLLAKEKSLNRYCSIYAKVPPLQENKDDPDYQYFLEKYKRGVDLSHEIAELNLRATDLLDVQKTLDNAFAGNIVELDYLIKRLADVIKTFKYIKTPVLIDNYKKAYCSFKNLQEIVTQKNEEFEEVLRKMEDISARSTELIKDRRSGLRGNLFKEW